VVMCAVMSRVSLDVNGRTYPADVELDSPLLYVLRDNLGLNNPRFGCGLGQCGACTVLVNGEAVRSCMLPVSSALDKKIVTLEGLGTPEHPHPLQQAFIDEQAFQCGYCLNGWVLVSKVLLDKNPNPSDQQIRQGLDGLICRCGSHVSVFNAVRRAADAMKKGGRA
jgi:nicotinate dehydrogenase subunit A